MLYLNRHMQILHCKNTYIHVQELHEGESVQCTFFYFLGFDIIHLICGEKKPKNIPFLNGIPNVNIIFHVIYFI